MRLPAALLLSALATTACGDGDNEAEGAPTPSTTEIRCAAVPDNLIKAIEGAATDRHELKVLDARLNTFSGLANFEFVAARFSADGVAHRVGVWGVVIDEYGSGALVAVDAVAHHFSEITANPAHPKIPADHPGVGEAKDCL
jgi:hypothetical protein